MNEAFFAELSAWLTQAGLAGTSETEIVSGFCDRCVAAGLPLARALMFVDTLHPVHEGRLFRWGYGPTESPLLEYGRTRPDALAASGSEPQDVEMAERWRSSPHYKMVQTGDSFLRRRLNATAKDEFAVLSDFLAAGMTDYVAIISRFAPEGVIGEMDGVYSSWATRAPDGFSDGQIAALQRIAPYFALAIKSVLLARMTGTLMQTYLGRDAGRRVLGGRIVRGIAERIDAVVWFSDLRGFTRVTDTAPEQAIPLLNDYSDAIVSAIHEHGGDVLKLIGDGTLAIFTAEDRAHACGAALSAAIAARGRIDELNRRRAADGKPITDMYLGLHVGEVFYGNVGSRERLDFTVIGPAVNEASRIAVMCRSVDQPVLMSSRANIARAALGERRAVIRSSERAAGIGYNGSPQAREITMNKILLATATFALVAAAAPLYAQQATTKDQLIGSWKVLSLKATTGDRVSYPLGEHVAGYVTVTPDRFWLLFADSTRKAPAAATLTDAEAVAMMKSHVAWTGKYSTAEQTPEGIKLTARVDAASSQAIFGTDRVYFMRLDGNKLMVKSPGVIVPMTGATSVVEFELVKAD
jgi:adenylate cyclase